MQGKICVITGATSGIGLAAAEKLAGMGASIVAVGRDSARCEATLSRLKAMAPEGEFRALIADLSRLSEMKRLAGVLLESEPRIDVLLNNAGALFTRREETGDGLEKTFALNHMAPFVVSNLLRERLAETPGARIVTTASIAHRHGALDFSDLQGANRYRGMKAYCDSKLANILFTRELARRLTGTGVTANCFHPGFVASRFGQGGSTGMRLLMFLLRPLAISPVKGAETAVYLASSPEVAETSGAYFEKCVQAEPAPQASDDEAARRLWTESARIAGIG